MNIRMITAAGLLLALAGCASTTTTPILPALVSNPVQDRWEGQSAGRFFASYGPPISDRDDGGNRVYTWRGGYKTVTIATKDGKKGGKRYLSCKADIVTSQSYVIRSVRILGDQPGTSGSSYCAELLAPPPEKAN
ncbi:hypothetical protein [Rhizobium rhizogenes]|uniref:Lipoprotein n=1 Tax=Rhizobium rhizogenes NBRC 13257 TaxID=1220581 RepID=A0AA87PWW5_RHIRH|nr:hypothetical protein [Rhizobium rhizogenes]KAA6491366.1 hypothetical protein DXT98_04315 [Agrobacterium sp. ICMP 7243]NTF47697.1 hypothetical protein [Rhizobium rhizogenes]NTF54193.1 hypothetical protein [Rhizobium rhizogenes]NTF60770.1 hypothetical protein [Rhizobium rhizogenes]NTF73774.1 hypothetical protein [Rhizobium rhizogenes]